MTLNLIYLNPVNNINETLVCNYPNIDNSKYNTYIDKINNYDINYLIKEEIKNLSYKNPIYPTNIKCYDTYFYSKSLSNFYFYLLKINNPIIYNKYIDDVIKTHIENIVYYDNLEKENKSKLVNKVLKSKKKVPKGFVKEYSRNVFTGEYIYIYKNYKTGETIESDNPNLLDELNKPKVKVKSKVVSVSLDAMTFSFSKKK